MNDKCCAAVTSKIKSLQKPVPYPYLSKTRERHSIQPICHLTVGGKDKYLLILINFQSTLLFVFSLQSVTKIAPNYNTTPIPSGDMKVRSWPVFLWSCLDLNNSCAPPKRAKQRQTFIKHVRFNINTYSFQFNKNFRYDRVVLEDVEYLNVSKLCQQHLNYAKLLPASLKVL